jgi:hypothetical protein
VFLLFSNAPDHFDVFNRDGVSVGLLTPNCKSWNMPCNMRIIAALKKRYKNIYLKNRTFNLDMEEGIKQIQRQTLYEKLQVFSLVFLFIFFTNHYKMFEGCQKMSLDELLLLMLLKKSRTICLRVLKKLQD